MERDFETFEGTKSPLIAGSCPSVVPLSLSFCWLALSPRTSPRRNPIPVCRRSKTFLPVQLLAHEKNELGRHDALES